MLYYAKTEHNYKYEMIALRQVLRHINQTLIVYYVNCQPIIIQSMNPIQLTKLSNEM